MKNKKPLFILGSIALLLLLLFATIPFFVNWYLNQNAEKIVSNMIIRTNDLVGHEVHFGNIFFDYDYRGTYLNLRMSTFNRENPWMTGTR
jgi:hypothetical protein